MTDALGPTHLTTYTHDGFDRLITTTFPDATHEDLTYVDGSGNLCSAAGNPCTKRNRAGEVLTFTYNALDWMLSKVSPNPAVTTSWTYDLNGAPNTLSDTAGNSIAYGYDTAGRKVTESQTIPGLTGAKTVTSTLDASSNRTGLTWADGYSVTYGFDSLNRMTSATDSANTLATYGYDPLSRRTNAAYAGGTSGASYGYSSAGDLLTLTDDLAGTTNDVTFTNTFTPAHQIASAAISNTAFRYTPPGNSTLPYTVNVLNQYATLNGTTQLYDARGNITGATSTPNIFVYDAENRMVALGAPFTGSSYAFDPLGRRTSKTISSVTTNFVHDGDTEIAEYDGSGNLIRRFVPGPAIDEYIAMVTATGTKTFFTTDKMGSVIAMADLSGNLVEGPYLYDSYGLCRVGGVTCGATGVPFRFTGQRLDAEIGAYYYRARMYSAGSGRFFQTDPVGYTADINLYAAFGNDPTDKTDPMGLLGVGIGLGVVDFEAGYDSAADRIYVVERTGVIYPPGPYLNLSGGVPSAAQSTLAACPQCNIDWKTFSATAGVSAGPYWWQALSYEGDTDVTGYDTETGRMTSSTVTGAGLTGPQGTIGASENPRGSRRGRKGNPLGSHSHPQAKNPFKIRPAVGAFFEHGAAVRPGSFIDDFNRTMKDLRICTGSRIPGNCF